MKKYYYTHNSAWQGPFSLRELNDLDLNIERHIWYPELCPNGMKTPDKCFHPKSTYGELIKNQKLMSLSISEQLCYSTVRIECQNSAGKSGTGTGFIFNFIKSETESIPVIITNKHVVRNMTIGQFTMTKADSSNNPIDNDHLNVRLNNLQTLVKNHPETEVDLCAIPLAPIINYAHQNSIKLFYKSFDKKLIPSKAQLDELTALEDILMIGYPNGIWDSVNNMPILRKGSTATHPCLDYNGKKEFMIDAACFPGSSGSPVLIFNQSGYTTKSGSYNIGGRRTLLMGILYAGPQHTASGEIKIINVPTKKEPVSFSRIPNNLGNVIKSEKILDLEALF